LLLSFGFFNAFYILFEVRIPDPDPDPDGLVDFFPVTSGMFIQFIDYST